MRGLDVVDGEHEGARLVRVGRLENFRPAGVAVERLGAEAAHELDLLGAMSSAVNGMRLAVRMRATICPTRPKPAMITCPSLSGGVS